MSSDVFPIRMPARHWIRAVSSVPASSGGAGAASAWGDAGEPALVEAAAAGNREAFDQIVLRHQRQVYSVCYRFAGNHEDASDLAQDVFVRAFRALPRFKRNAALATWLYRIAVNTSLNRVSKQRAQFESMSRRTERASDAEGADLTLVRSEQAARVRAAIAKLPRRQRATVILRVYHELAHEQIAEILGSSVGAAKTNFFHAMANLRKLLRGQAR